jgi:hypothetical protein
VQAEGRGDGVLEGDVPERGLCRSGNLYEPIFVQQRKWLLQRFVRLLQRRHPAWVQ